MSLKEKLNGKKRYLVGGIGLTTALSFLIPFLINLSGTVSANEVRIKNNGENYQRVEQMPEQVARIEEQVQSIKEDFVDFRTEQRKYNEKTEYKLDRILEAVAR